MSFKKFVVISPGRSGSSLLMDLLGNHPNILTFGEIFGTHEGSLFSSQVANTPNRDTSYVINHIFSNQNSTIDAIGFKLLYHQGHPKFHSKFKNDVVWKNLKSMNDLGVIHLWREDYLGVIRSLEVAKNKNDWDSKSPTINISVNIDPQFCLDVWKYLDWGYTYVRELFSKRHFLEITYEDLKDNQENTLDKILDFLGTNRMKLSTSLKKQNTTPLNEGIENYGELKCYFKNTKWERYFI